MTAAATLSVAQAGVGHLIHTGWGGDKPNVEDVSSALRAWGFCKARETVVRYGVADCAAAITYVGAQKGRYAARSPGALVRWLLENKDSLSGWHWSRVRGFLVRFRSLPEWMLERIARWLGLSAPPEPSARRRKPATAGTAASPYKTWEEVQAQMARDERRYWRLFGGPEAK